MVLWQPPERFPSTRKVISLTFQEKVCLTMNYRELTEGIENHSKLFIADQIVYKILLQYKTCLEDFQRLACPDLPADLSGRLKKKKMKTLIPQICMKLSNNWFACLSTCCWFVS